MTLTVLFDLDNTLLNTNFGAFLPAYFVGLGQTLADYGSQQRIVDQIHYAVGKMTANQDPSKLLKQVFAENFYPPLGTSEEKCRERLADFYSDAYPKLASHVKVKPEAHSLVQWCKSQGFRLAITTNPLFPETATRQRIFWAGLDPDDFHFFSSYDTFHFTKPNLRYYAEAIGRLGWPEGPIVMVGDDLTLDVLPAGKMGAKSFWVVPGVVEPGKPQGTLTGVRAYLESLQRRFLKFTLLNDPEVLLAVLRSSPAVLDSWLKIYEQETLHHPPREGEWSANEVFWHLADFEEQIYLPQWRGLLKDPDQIIPHIETSHWDAVREYASRKADEACQRFMHLRLASLEAIESLYAQGLFERSVHHTVFSEARIGELVAFTAKHDWLHLQQCADTMNI